MKNKNMNRKIYLDVLRIIAIVLVLFHHTNWRGFTLFLGNDGFEGAIYLCMSILCEVAVPIFFMISGALLLKKDESIKTVLVQRVLKFVVVLFVITVVYYFYDVLFNNKEIGNFQSVLNAFMTCSASSALWYLYAYIALLMMLPLIRNMVKNTTQNQYIYLIILNIIFVGILPVASFVLTKGKYYYTNTFDVIFATTISWFFFLMGHFFENVVDKTFYKIKNCVLLSVGSLMVLMVCSILTRKWLGVGFEFADSTTKGFHYTLVAIPTFSIYAWVKYIFCHINVKERVYKVVSHIGQCTFGIYLLERIIWEQTAFIHDWLNGFLPCIVACWLWVLVMLIIGIVVVSLIKLMPIIKKYI